MFDSQSGAEPAVASAFDIYQQRISRLSSELKYDGTNKLTRNRLRALLTAIICSSDLNDTDKTSLALEILMTCKTAGFEIVKSDSVNFHRMPMVVANILQYYDALLSFLELAYMQKAIGCIKLFYDFGHRPLTTNELLSILFPTQVSYLDAATSQSKMTVTSFEHPHDTSELMCLALYYQYPLDYMLVYHIINELNGLNNQVMPRYFCDPIALPERTKQLADNLIKVTYALLRFGRVILQEKWRFDGSRDLTKQFIDGFFPKLEEEKQSCYNPKTFIQQHAAELATPLLQAIEDLMSKQKVTTDEFIKHRKSAEDYRCKLPLITKQFKPAVSIRATKELDGTNMGYQRVSTREDDQYLRSTKK